MAIIILLAGMGAGLALDAVREKLVDDYKAYKHRPKVRRYHRHLEIAK